MIVNGIKRRTFKRFYNDEHLEYFKEIVPGHYVKEIIEMFYQKFGIRYNKNQIENFKKTYGLYSNVKNWNKGMKNPYDPSREIGEERPRYRNGKLICVEIKIAPNKWVRKAHYIWEQYYGKIPDNHCIIHKDGDKFNCDINNLELISYADKIIFNYNNLKYNQKIDNANELLKTNLLISQVMQKRNKIKKKRRYYDSRFK